MTNAKQRTDSGVFVVTKRDKDHDMHADVPAIWGW